MARPKRETIEDQVVKIINNEITQGEANIQYKVDDFESAIDLLECERIEKNYDWQSDICLPEFASQMLTLAADEAGLYFQTRDFVEVYLEDDSEESIARAEANKELINRTLNQNHLHHYYKFMRANINKDVAGEVFIRCGWEQKRRIDKVPVQRMVESDVDEFGNEIVDRSVQVPRREIVQELQDQEVVYIDRFNYDIIDRRNVIMDNIYTYSLQDKRFVIIREEKTVNELKEEADSEGYINLEALMKKGREKIQPPAETETSQKSHNKDEEEQPIPLKDNEPYDIYHRYGKFWAVVSDVDDNGLPMEIDYGLDQNGEVRPKAELVECLITTLKSGGHHNLIRFIPTPFVDSNGNPYRPLIRGICYIHPTKDGGLGDGKYSRELNVGINDTFNVSNDRTMLSTMPTFTMNEFDIEDNTQIYFEPGHAIPTKTGQEVKEFKIDDNIAGALSQINLLRTMMSQVTSKFPPALGNVPELASTTATAVAGATQSEGKRDNYRNLTFEHTLLNPLYWMITQMTWQFAQEETAYKLMGDKAQNFDPSADFTYKPLSQSIETEYSKANQIRELNQMLSVLAPVVQINPKGAALINFLVAKQMELFGDEYTKFSKFLLDENSPVGGQTGTNQPLPAQNQTGLPQTGAEQAARA